MTIVGLAERDVSLGTRVLEGEGLWPVQSDYVLRFWLPIVGPTVYCTAQLAAFYGQLRRTWAAHDLAHALGLSHNTTTLARAISRSVTFGWAEVAASNADSGLVRWTFVDKIRTLRSYQVKHLSPAEQDLHGAWLQAS